MRRPLPIALPLAAGALTLLAGCGSDGGAPSKTTAVGCVKTAEPRPKLGLRGPKRVQPLGGGDRWHAIVATNCGSFTIALDTADSPKTTAAFAGLARSGFYDDLTFHRVAPGFVIQGGDPLGSGTGGPGWSITEKPPRDTRYLHGVVAMAKTATDPDGTSGSQFFIVTGSDADLPAQYALLGRVTAGLDVVDLIDALPLQETDPQGSPPVDPVVIQSVTIAEG